MVEYSRKQVLVVIVIIAVLSSIVAVFVFFNQSEKWVSVASWNGQTTDVAMTTEPFTINGTEWRVNWQIGAYTTTAHCNIFIYNADTNVLINGNSLAVPTASGEIRLNTTGRFYLKIGINGTLSSWAVYVFEKA